MTLFAQKVGSGKCDDSLLETVFVGLASKRVNENEINARDIRNKTEAISS